MSPQHLRSTSLIPRIIIFLHFIFSCKISSVVSHTNYVCNIFLAQIPYLTYVCWTWENWQNTRSYIRNSMRKVADGGNYVNYTLFYPPNRTLIEKYFSISCVDSFTQAQLRFRLIRLSSTVSSILLATCNASQLRPCNTQICSLVFILYYQILRVYHNYVCSMRNKT